MRSFIKGNFKPDDRLAVACKYRDGWFWQYFVSAKILAEARSLEWLKKQNNLGANIYIGMNALKPDAQQRTKRNVAAVRHVYLDIDHDGEKVLGRIVKDSKTPDPSCLLYTSPGRYQMVWKVENFSAEEAEALNRGMAAEYGADPAAIDVSRTLRFPGFLNHKYNPPCMVGIKLFSELVYTPSDFGVNRLYEQSEKTASRENRGDSGVDTQSHRDWREVRRRLEAGQNPIVVQADLAAAARSRGKASPEKYAETTVRKAQAKSAIEMQNRASWIAARHAVRNIHDISETTQISEQEKISNQEDILKQTEKSNEQKPEPAQTGTDKYKTPEKTYVIGTPPAGISEAIRNMSLEAKKRREAGMLWNDKLGWNTTNEKLAEAVHQMILGKQPRFYIEGDTYQVKDQLAAIKDENEKHIAFFDRYKKAWFALSEENRNNILREIDIPPAAPKREKFYLEPADRIEREAIFLCKEEFKEIREPNAEGRELKTFAFDEAVGMWYTYSPTAFEKAQYIVVAQMNDPDFLHEMEEKGLTKDNGKEPHKKIPLNIDGIPTIELRKQMKDKGCSPDGKIWVAPNEKIAKEVQALIDAAPKRGNAIFSPSASADAPGRETQNNHDSGGMGDD